MAPKLVIEEGAMLNGTVKMGADIKANVSTTPKSKTTTPAAAPKALEIVDEKGGKSAPTPAQA